MGEGQEPKYYRLARNVKLYGVEAVFGRSVLYEYEMDNMRLSKYIVDAYQGQTGSGNWSEWERANPQAAKTLNWAMDEWKKING